MSIRVLVSILVYVNCANAQLFFEQPPRNNFVWKDFGDETLGYSIGVVATLFEGSEVAGSGLVACAAGDQDEQADFLRFDSIRRHFLSGEIINNNRPVNLSPSENINRHNIVLLRYSWQWQSIFKTNITSVTDFVPGVLDAYVGFRDYLDNQPHYGWAHLRRASTNAGVAFFLVDWAVNPFPGQPIRAGEPPELPQLTTVVDIATDPGNPLLRVSWPAGFPGVKLQTTADLTPPVQWLDQELSGERLAVVAPPAEGQLFFRLVWAGP
jgi:hypothetical protein